MKDDLPINEVRVSGQKLDDFQLDPIEPEPQRRRKPVLAQPPALDWTLPYTVEQFFRDCQAVLAIQGQGEDLPALPLDECLIRVSEHDEDVTLESQKDWLFFRRELHISAHFRATYAERPGLWKEYRHRFDALLYSMTSNRSRLVRAGLLVEGETGTEDISDRLAEFVVSFQPPGNCTSFKAQRVRLVKAVKRLTGRRRR